MRIRRIGIQLLFLASALGSSACVGTGLESPSQQGTAGSGSPQISFVAAGAGSPDVTQAAAPSGPSPAARADSQPSSNAAPAPSCMKTAAPACGGVAGTCNFATELRRDARCQSLDAHDSRPFLARCGSYDAVVSSDSDAFWAVLYDRVTGQPLGAFQQGPFQACAWYGEDRGSPYGLTCVALDGACPGPAEVDASVAVAVDAGGPNATPPDASVPAPADKCAAAMHVALGASLTGTTCGGVSGPATICGGTESVFVYVDAPDGVTPKIDLSPGAGINAYPTCISDHAFECAGWQSTYVPSDPRYRLFAITRLDTACGDFTIKTSAP